MEAGIRRHDCRLGRRSVPLAVGCTTVGAVLVAGCSYTYEGEAPDAPLVIEPAPTEPGGPLGLDPVGSSGLFAPSAWPSACELLTDDEITAVLPQATVTEREADDQEFRDVETLGTFTVREGACSYRLDIPEAGLGPEDTMIRVGLDAVGSPEVVARNVTALPEDTRIEVSGGQCFGSTTSTVRCHKGPLAFTLHGILGTQQHGSDAWTNRYQVGGKTKTFTGSWGTNEGQAEEGEFLRDSLCTELVAIILAKV